MIVKSQKPIEFINDCNCIVDEDELRNAILWYQKKPTLRLKHIYKFGRYPAISIHDKKIHVHRLLAMYWSNSIMNSSLSVHHKNGNRLDNRRANLEIMTNSLHSSLHNKGKKPSKKSIIATIEFNHKRKGTRMKRKRNDVTPEMVLSLKNKGLSFKQISKLYHIDWGCVKQRYNDAIHDNPSLLKGGTK